MTINVTITSALGSECNMAEYLRDPTNNGGIGSTITDFGADFIKLAFNQTVLGQNIHLVLQGTGFSYAVNGEFTSGTITGILTTLDDDVTAVSQVTGISIPAAALYAAMVANDGGASMQALLFDQDSFNYTGNDGADKFTAGSKDDLLNGGAGADELVGGGGRDTITYADSVDPVTIDLFSNTNKGGDAEGDQLSEIENVIGTAGDDVLTGDNEDNVLTGSAGADTLDGGDGSDTASYAGSNAGVTVSLVSGALGVGGHAQGDALANMENLIGSDFADTLTGDDADNVIEGGKGADVMVGGGGNDTVSYRNSAAGVSLTLGAAGAQTVGSGAGSDALGDKVGGFQNIIGGLGNDGLTGNELANRLEGGAGNDIAKGNAGDDTLIGGAGNDTLDGGIGNDFFMGGAGADTVTGGDGTADTASYADSDQAVTIALGLNGALGTASGGNAEGDKISFVENLIGSALNDVLTGNNLANVIEGGDGDDTLSGGDNKDGKDVNDTASYAGSSGPVFVDLTLQGSAQDTVSAGNDTLVGFENLVGSSQSDTLTGDDKNNVIEGGGGADTLTGGDGEDTASYARSTAGVTVDLSIVGLAQVSGGDADGDTFTDQFENLVGSALDDVLTGDASSAEIKSIKGLAGNDLIAGLPDFGTFDGGDGVDTIDFSKETGPIAVVLAAANVTSAVTTNGNPSGKILNFENVIGTTGDDKITGNAADNVIEGGVGNDTLDGGTGNDTLSFAGSIAPVVLDLSSATIVSGFAKVDLGGGEFELIKGFETILGSLTQSDAITGDGANNIIDGGGGDDTLDGKGGADTVSYASSQGDGLGGGVTVNLGESGAKTDNNGVASVEFDSLSNFEHIIGSKFDDTLTGNDSFGNSIKGGAGNDTIDGKAGADVLDGGAGDDKLLGGAGADGLDGGAGFDIADYSAVTTALTVALGANGAKTTVTAPAGTEPAGDTLTNIEGVIGGSANDALTGNALANLLSGGDGNDNLIGGAGADALDGGADIDQISYAASAFGVSIKLDGTNVTVGKGGDAEGDQISSVEKIIGSTKDDVLIGDGSDNGIDGGAGNDWIEGGESDDSLQGGVGVDTVSFASAGTGVKVDLSNTTTKQDTNVGQDLLAGFENVVGSANSDELTGDKNANVIEGGAGADTLTGGGGNDTLSYAKDTAGVTVDLGGPTSGGDADGDTISGFVNLVGGSGDDTLTGDGKVNLIDGGAGDDTVTGGLGADVLEGGAGSDLLDYSSIVDKTKSVTVALGTPGTQTAVTGTALEASGDKIRNFEDVNGGAGNDKLTGNAAANVLNGGDGDDTLDGGVGADTFIGGDGNDTYIVDNSGDVIVEGVGEGAKDQILSSVNYTLGPGSGVEKLTLTGTAGINGTGNELANEIVGNAGNNVIEGGDEADLLDGAGGIDTLSYAGDNAGVTVTLAGTNPADVSGNSGNDAEGDVAKNFENLLGGSGDDKLTGDSGANVIEGGAGADDLDGGDGNDTLSYAGSAFGVVVDLEAGTGSGGDATGDTIANFESFLGSNGDDIAVGNGGDNKLDGGGGDDDLTGADGNDTIVGGAGDDTVEGGAGKDILDGGAGSDDWLWYGNSAAGITVSLNTSKGVGKGGEAEGDSYSNFEHVVGSFSSDVLQGGVGTNILVGLSGNDKLDGASGADIMIGGIGDDTYVVDNADDVAFENPGEGTDTIQASFSYALSAGTEIENLVLTGTGAINATGNDLANKLTGNGGNNVLDGGGGGDLLDGDKGIDTASYASDATGVTVSLTTGSGTGGNAEGDILVNIENLTGGSGNDTLSGDKNANVLDGGAGDDLLNGGAGADKLIGGAGDDTASYAGSSAGVTVKLALATAQAGGDAAGDTLSGIENVIGSGANDVLVGNGKGTLQGSDGDDTLSNASELSGGTGSDTYIVDAAVTPVIVEAANEGTDTVLASVTIGGLDDNVENLTLTGKADIDGAGNDLDNVIAGNEGKNNLDGGDGDDTLAGGKGADSLTGGDGNDTYVYKTGDGADTITDFVAGGTEDRINLLGTSITSLSGVLALAKDVGSDVVIDFGKGDTLTLVGVQKADLGAADFVINSAGNQAPTDITLSSTSTKSDVTVGTTIGTLGAVDPDTGDKFSFALPDDAGGLFAISGNTIKTNGALSAGNYDIVVRVTDSGGQSYSEGFTITVTKAQSLSAITPLTGAGSTGSGNDDIKGTPGVDSLAGLAGNDVLRGLGSGDVLDGGLGIDTASYFDATTGVTANLADPGANTGDAKGDTYISIEALRGTRFNDLLVGNDEFNTLNGGPGSDTLDGGNGADVATYQNSGTLVTVSLADPGMNTGEAAGDKYISIERLRGSTFDDFLQGDNGDNALEGFTGADKLDGGNGFDYARYNIAPAGVTVTLDGAKAALNTGDAKGDTFISIEGLWGSDFNDKLIGDANDSTMKIGNAGSQVTISNVLVGGAGADVLDGGGGFDLAAYFTSPAFGTGGVVVNLGNPALNTGDAAGDGYISIEGLWGSSFADSLTGDENDNVLLGDAGDDILGGGTADGSDGKDFFDGGDGVDIVSYAAATVGFTASLKDATQNTGAATGDTYAVTSNNGDGTNKTNTTNIEGLRGGSGDDTLIGNATNVTFLIGGAGADSLIGSKNGRDTADYRYSTGGLTVSLIDPSKNTGEAAGDKFTSIERLRGSAFDDYLQGNNKTSNSDNPSGNDDLEGGAGADILDGSDGFDFARYFSSSVGVTVSFADSSKNTGDAKGDVFISIEGLWGSQFDDLLVGAAGNDSLMGGAGNDILDGGAGTDDQAFYNNTPTMQNIGVTADLANSNNNTADAKGDVYLNIEGIGGSSFADLLAGDAGNNRLDGRGASDILIGRGGADRLDGGDSFSSTAATDVDIASYRDSASGVTADLRVGTNVSDSNTKNFGDAKGDTYVGIDGLEGSSKDDYLTGRGSGNDTLIGGAGADKLDGLGGTDTASYETSAGAVTANLDDISQNKGDAEGDSYFNIDNLRGGAGDDDLIGSINGNVDGNTPDNVIDGGAGDDWMHATGGKDTYIGGTGWDTLTFWFSKGQVTVDLGATTAQTVGDVDGDAGTADDQVTLSKQDIEAVVGSEFDDQLTASNGANKSNYLDGWDGDDTLIGGTGNDILVGGFGNDAMTGGDGNDTINSAFNSQTFGTPTVDDGTDTIVGGNGVDTVTYADAVGSVTVDLTNTGDQDTGGGGVDKLSGIENITGGTGNDVLTGEIGDNILDGGVGDDKLSGGAGNDLLIGGAGADVLDGGADTDTVSYQFAAAGLTAQLNNPLAGIGDAAGDKYVSIENLIGSQFSDKLQGDNNNNELYGLAGDDNLNGQGGDDKLFGGEGNDFFTAGGSSASSADGNDEIDGGGGFDTVSYDFVATKEDGFTASLADQNLNTGIADGDEYTSIENLRGGDGNDTLMGDANNNTINGGFGDDVLDGGGGFDTAAYTEITDGNVGVTVDLRIQGVGKSQNTGGSGTDTLIGFRNLAGGAGADLLIGDDNLDFGNRLFGNNGNDILVGGLGLDILDGGSGSDVASYRFATKGITANLANSSLNTGDAAGDIYVFDSNNINSIEGLEGSNFDDVLVGDEGQNSLRGGVGKDTLIGGGGTDNADYRETTTGITVNLADPTKNTGNAAGDKYVSIEGIFGGSGNDTLIGDAGNNTLQGNAGADKIDGGAGVDIASYGFATTSLTISLDTPGTTNTGEAAGDTYTSIEGLSGGSANDVLIGDAGDNYLRGSGGGDKLDGGAGFDYAGYWLFNPGTGPLLTVNLGDPSKNTPNSEAKNDSYFSIEGVIGSDFNDTLIGDSGVNILVGGAGKDVIQDVGGNDFAGYYQFFTRALQIGVTVNLGDTKQNTGDAVGDTYVGIKNLYGSQFNDELIGDAGDNILNGGDGLDILDGGAGNDTLIGGAGYNSYHGGDGFDTVSYDASPVGLTIGFPELTGPNTINDFADGTVEYILGTKFADKIQAGGFGQFVDGGDGNDVISTFGAVMIGGAGADVLDGGPIGFNTVSYQTAATGVTIDLSLATQKGGDAEGDKFISIESVIGSSHNDVLIGVASPNGETLDGGAGDDSLKGGGMLIGGLGADKFEGTGFLATISYETAEEGVTVDLTNPGLNDGDDAIGDTYSGNFNEIRGTAFDDVINAPSVGNLGGGDGDDELHGAFFVEGGKGADVLDGIVATYHTAASGLTVNLLNLAENTGDAKGDTYGSNINGLWGSAFNDTLISFNKASNGLNGGDGDDKLVGGTDEDHNILGGMGNDTMTGGTGNDQFVFQSSTDGFDTITDFKNSSGEFDVIIIGGFGFGLDSKAGAGAGPAEWAGAKFLTEEFFVSGSGVVADKAHGQFLFDTKDASHHILYFDPDGTGAAAKVALADFLTGSLTVDHIGIFV